jgi:hypothetical protein
MVRDESQPIALDEIGAFEILAFFCQTALLAFVKG